MNEISSRITEFEGIVLSFNRLQLEDLLKDLKGSNSREEIINELISPALEHIGQLWESGDIALSQVYMVSRLCENIINNLFPITPTEQIKTPIVGMAVLEDSHALGMNIIEYILKAAGYKYYFYDTGINVETLIEKCISDKIEILLVSTLMYRSALKIEELSSKLKEINPNIKIIVGGAPFIFDNELKERVGADATTKNVFQILDIIEKLREGDD